jgi:hypothetical protein
MGIEPRPLRAIRNWVFTASRTLCTGEVIIAFGRFPARVPSISFQHETKAPRCPKDRIYPIFAALQKGESCVGCARSGCLQRKCARLVCVLADRCANAARHARLNSSITMNYVIDHPIKLGLDIDETIYCFLTKSTCMPNSIGLLSYLFT